MVYGVSPIQTNMAGQKVYSFTIPGDPVPYLRMTQGQVRLMRIPDHRLDEKALVIKERIRRYLNYKEEARIRSASLKFNKKPKEKVFFNAVIYFRNKAHGDPENIKKGIQDAIFENDKMVGGSIDFYYDPLFPRVECEVVE